MVGRVLVVDDLDGNIRLKRSLLEAGGHQLACAQNVAGAPPRSLSSGQRRDLVEAFVGMVEAGQLPDVQRTPRP